MVPIGLGFAPRRKPRGFQGPPLSDGLTVDATWPNRGALYSDLSGTDPNATMRMLATFDRNDDGILWEAGATGTGLICYVAGGVLYFKCGAGNTSTGSAAAPEVSWTIPAGPARRRLIEVSAHASANRVILAVDGVQVAQNTSASFTQIAGANEGTIGEAGNGCAFNRGGWTDAGQGVFTGALEPLAIMLGEVLAPATG